MLKHWFLFAMAGLSGLLYGIDIGVIAAALPYLKAATAFTDAQLSLIVGAVVMGAVVSALFAGVLADRFGRRPVILLAAASFTLSIPVICLSNGSFSVMMCGRLVQGVSQGLISVVMPMFLVETLPPEIRGRGTGFFHLMLSIGLVAVSAIGFAIACCVGDAASGAIPLASKALAWKMNFWIAGVPGVLLLLGCIRLKESPYWLSRKTSQTSQTSQTSSSSDSVWRRKYVLPFVLVFLVVVCTQATGTTAILNYSVQLLSEVGLPGASANAADAVIKTVNLLVTLLAMSLVDRKGRTFLLKCGTAGIALAHVLAAGLYFALRLGVMSPSPAAGIMMTVSFVFLVACYALGPGVCVWLVMSELLPGRIRANGIGISLFANRCMAMAIASFFLPWMNAWGRDGVFLTFAVSAVAYFIVVKCFLPETKGKSLAEIEGLFNRETKWS